MEMKEKITTLKEVKVRITSKEFINFYRKYKEMISILWSVLGDTFDIEEVVEETILCHTSRTEGDRIAVFGVHDIDTLIRHMEEEEGDDEEIDYDWNEDNF